MAPVILFCTITLICYRHKTIYPAPERVCDVINRCPLIRKTHLSRPDQGAAVDHVEGALRVRDADKEGGHDIR